MDHTLLKPKGGKKFSKGPDDALLVFPEITEKLNQLRREGWTINLFTNQKKTKKEKVPVDHILTKTSRLLGDDINIFISYQNDFYRKPSLGMWDELLRLNEITQDEVEDVFYVGDASGRPNDFSDSDRAFAHNINIKFYTPEQYFQGKQEVLPEHKILWPEPIPFDLSLTKPTILMMIGRQGSGKSFLSHELKVENKADIVSNDQTKSNRKTQKMLTKAIENKEPLIIIDNTHPSKASRQQFLEITTGKGYQVIGIICRLEDKLCRHLDAYRSYQKKIKRLPDVAFAVFNKKYQEPELSEGFDNLVDHIPNIPDEIKRYWF